MNLASEAGLEPAHPAPLPATPQRKRRVTQ
jgi:hypothetical protein